MSFIKNIGKQLLFKLKTLHEVGWVHNDVKPGNILFGRK